MIPIPGYSEYSINEDGTQIKRLTRNRRAFIKPSNQMINGKPSGYLYVTLLSRDTASYGLFRIAVHRLVAFAYHGQPPEGKPWVNHKDGNKANNHYLNLEWSSISQNIKHAYDTGLKQSPKGMSGKTHSNSSKSKMSISKRGNRHPKYKGDYWIEGRIFQSLQDAAMGMGISSMTIFRRIKSGQKGYKLIIPIDQQA